MYENPIYTYFSRYSKIYWFLVKNAYVNRTKGRGGGGSRDFYFIFLIFFR